MIYDSLENLHKYVGKSNNLDRAIAFLMHFKGNPEVGKIIIDEENIFANVMTYETKVLEEEIFEAHKIYLDIHVVLEGEEKLYNAPIEQLKEIKGYEKENDCAFYKGKAIQECILKPKEFIIYYPQDGHIPGVRLTESAKVKKMVVKVKVD